MDALTATIVLFGLLILFLVFGLPLAFTLGGVAMIGVLFIWGPIGLSIAAAQIWAAMSKFSLLAIPLFILMAMLLERAGVANDLYAMMHRWLGGIRGGLASGTVLICTSFAAMSGISGAATVSMGVIALPEMLKRGYDKKIAMGCIAGGGALGILIPPSVIMILYGIFTGESIGALFMGGVFPGMLLAVLFIAYISIRCQLQKGIGPALPTEERASWKEKFTSLRAVALPLLIIFMVLGGIYLGVVTPSEAAAVGVLGAVISAVIYRKFNLTLVKEATFRTANLAGMIIWILMGAYCFTAIYQASGAKELMEGLLLAIPGGRYAILISIQLTFFVLGMILDPAGILMICTPVFVPVITALGFSPLWFGILFVMNMEMGYLTPPFGFNLFYMKAVAPKGTTMGEIYGAIFPFVLLQALGLVIVILVPAIALWLPAQMIR